MQHASFIVHWQMPVQHDDCSMHQHMMNGVCIRDGTITTVTTTRVVVMGGGDDGGDGWVVMLAVVEGTTVSLLTFGLRGSSMYLQTQNM